MTSDFAVRDKGWRHAASRLAGMYRNELIDRSGQELAKRVDVLLSRAGSDFARGLIDSARVNPGQFFFASASVPSLLQLLRHRLPRLAQHLVRHAHTICRHQFDLLGYENLEYGDPIDWHL